MRQSPTASAQSINEIDAVCDILDRETNPTRRRTSTRSTSIGKSWAIIGRSFQAIFLQSGSCGHKIMRAITSLLGVI